MLFCAPVTNRVPLSTTTLQTIGSKRQGRRQQGQDRFADSRDGSVFIAGSSDEVVSEEDDDALSPGRTEAVGTC